MTTPRQPRPAPARPRSRWLLPEDGIADEIAIELAASGARAVPLTPGERRAAAARILAAGGTPWQISCRLHMNSQAACALAVELAACHDTGAAA